MLTLHYAPGTIAAVVAITLFEMDVPFTPVRVDFANGEQRGEAYLALNPKGRVPTLVTERGVLTETAAILDYLAALHPQAHLVPDDPFDAARMRSVMTYLASTAHVNHAHKMRGHRWADSESSWADMKARVPVTMNETAAFLENHAVTGPFVLGQAMSLADPYLYMVVNWMPGDGVDLAGFPRLDAFHRTMLARPSVIRARAEGYL